MKKTIIVYLTLTFLPFNQVIAGSSDLLDEVTIKVIPLDEIQLDHVEIIDIPSITELDFDKPFLHKSNTEITTTPENADTEITTIPD